MKLKVLVTLMLIAIIGSSVFAQDPTATPTPAGNPTATPEPKPVCPAFEGQSVEVRTSYYLGEGLAFFNSNQNSAAEFSFTCIIEVIDEDSIPAYMNRAAVRTVSRFYEEAIEDYSEALERDDSLTAAYNNRGILYTALSEEDLAAADFEQVIAIAPDNLLGYNNKAVYQIINGDLDGALATLDIVVEKSEVESQLEQVTREEEPLNVFDLEVDRNAARAYALRGIIYTQIALSNYEAYLALQPNGDYRIADIAGSLQSRFAFDLRLDDGTWWLAADYDRETGQ